MSTQPSGTIPVPVLHCKYPDCGNDWVPRTTRMPKVCPKCKRYNWETGRTKKRRVKGGKKHVKKSSQLGPKTQEFLQQRVKET